MIQPLPHQRVSHDDPVNRAGHHLFQHAGAAQLMNVTGKEIGITKILRIDKRMRGLPFSSFPSLC